MRWLSVLLYLAWARAVMFQCASLHYLSFGVLKFSEDLKPERGRRKCHISQRNSLSTRPSTGVSAHKVSFYFHNNRRLAGAGNGGRAYEYWREKLHMLTGESSTCVSQEKAWPDAGGDMKVWPPIGRAHWPVSMVMYQRMGVCGDSKLVSKKAELFS